MGPFLVELKSHLENVQVCLDEIDSWRMYSQDTKSFLESLFSIELETPIEEHIEKSSSPRHGDCRWCGMSSGCYAGDQCPRNAGGNTGVKTAK